MFLSAFVSWNTLCENLAAGGLASVREPESPNAQTSRNRETKENGGLLVLAGFLFGNGGVCGQCERVTEHP